MDKKNQALFRYLQKNDPAFWNTIGKDFNNPTVIMNELIRHYQWIYYMGNIDELDLQATCNKYYKETFIEVLARNPEFRDQFLNYFFNVLKVAYDDEKKAWYKDIVITILVNNKRLFWFDYVAIYALICSSYNVMRWMLVHDYVCDPRLGIDKIEFIKLMDGISNQEFYDELKRRIKKERASTLKNIYICK